MEEEQELEQELEQEEGEEVFLVVVFFEENCGGFRDEEEVEADLEPASDTNDYTSSSDYSDDSYVISCRWPTKLSKHDVKRPERNVQRSNVCISPGCFCNFTPWRVRKV